MSAAVANFDFSTLVVNGEVDPQDIIHTITTANLEVIKHFLALITMPEAALTSQLFGILNRYAFWCAI